MKEFRLVDAEALQILKALSSLTNRKILQLLIHEQLDVSTIATRLNLSQPRISEGVQQLERLQLVTTRYAAGKRGVRKVCELAIDKLILTFKDHT